MPVLLKKSALFLFFILILIFAFGCEQSEQAEFQGYIEGEFIYLASSQTGRLQHLAIQRGDSVDKNTLLFTLEAEYEQQAVKQATQELFALKAELENMQTGKRPEEISMVKAQLAQAQSKAANATALLKRNRDLLRSGGISQQEFDDSQTAAKALKAQVTELLNQVAVYNLPERSKKIESQQASLAAAQAKLKQAQWKLEQKTVYAPSAGLIYETLFSQGELVQAGKPVVQLLAPEKIKIRFFVPEHCLGKIHIKDKVQVHIDGCCEPVLAYISYIAPKAEYTPPIIFSNETRSKLVFMLEAQVPSSVAASLHPGQPVQVSLQ